MNNYERFCSPGKKIAVLIDPDKPTDEEMLILSAEAERCGVDFIFVGGSLLTNNGLNHCIRLIRSKTTVPVILFPGNTHQVSHLADSFLFLSLISGRNPDMLIGAHVIAAPYLKISGLEVISTGYMLIESGRPTTVSYMSNSFPIPSDKNDIAMCTAMAGEMLGMKLIFMDAGSGALNPVPDSMIQSVKASIGVPLVIGGGIKTPEMAAAKLKAGADVVVIGNMLEKQPQLMASFVEAVRNIS
ncbi:geranylgeranylglyceryl/heptaprenylglyceryl phosphate synthase [Bacteroidales bacterium]